MRRTAALIVGGGPAGAAAGITLGRTALIVERSAEPGDALCGGFLSWRTLDALARLGIEADALNRARVRRLRLFAGRRMAEAMLPRPALGVSRRRLDALLLDRAAASGAGVERGVAVRALDERTARFADGGQVTGDVVLLATGKHDLRGHARPLGEDDPALGLRLRLAASPTLDRLVGDAIELHLFDGGYAGVVMQEDGSVNLCMAVRRSRLRGAGGAEPLLRELAREAPHLADRLGTGVFEPIDAVANVPYGWRAGTTRPGLYRLGDQAGVIPSLAGEGMGIAIASGVSAARAILAGIDAPPWQRGFATRLARPLAVAGLVRAAAERPATAALLTIVARPPAIRAVARLTRIRHDGVDVSRPDPHS